MGVVVITAAAAVVTAAAAKTARVFSKDDEDSFVEALLAAAQSHVDGPEGYLGRCIGMQTLQMDAGGGHDCGILLPFPPAVEIVSVTSDGADIDATSFRLSGNTLYPVGTVAWPDCMTVTWKAGYETPPAALSHAIMLIAGRLRASGMIETGIRSEQVDGVGQIDYSAPGLTAAALQDLVGPLLAPFRVYA